MASILRSSAAESVNSQKRASGADGRDREKKKTLPEDITLTFANVIFPLTKFIAAICVTMPAGG